MFGRNRRQPEEPKSETTGRYKVEFLRSAKTAEAFPPVIEAALNEGDARGWRLINVQTPISGAFIFWDTEPDRT